MHLQQVSEIFFDDVVAMPTPSRAPSARAPAWQTPACAMDDSSSATRHLLPLLESLCRSAMRRCLEPGEAIADAIELRIERGHPTDGARLRVAGWVEQIGDRSATFRLRAHAVEGTVLEATLKLDLAPLGTTDAASPCAAPRAQPSRGGAGRTPDRTVADSPAHIPARTYAWLP